MCAGEDGEGTKDLALFAHKVSLSLADFKQILAALSECIDGRKNGALCQVPSLCYEVVLSERNTIHALA